MNIYFLPSQVERESGFITQNIWQHSLVQMAWILNDILFVIILFIILFISINCGKQSERLQMSGSCSQEVAESGCVNTIPVCKNRLILPSVQVWENALRRQYIGALNVSNFFPKIQLVCQLSLLTSSKLKNWIGAWKESINFPKTQLAREILHTYDTLSIQGHSRIAPCRLQLISSRVQSKAHSVTHRQTDQPITVWISLREVRVCDFSLLYSKILCGESREWRNLLSVKISNHLVSNKLNLPR